MSEPLSVNVRGRDIDTMPIATKECTRTLPARLPAWTRTWDAELEDVMGQAAVRVRLRECGSHVVGAVVDQAGGRVVEL